MQEEDVYFLKIHLNFVLTSKNKKKKKKRKRNLLKLNKATGLRGGDTVLKIIDGTKHDFKFEKQANLLLFSPLRHNCD